jgi:hypothetical protein
MNLVKLKATAKAEELKARIRAAKMMSQGVTYRQVVHVTRRDQQPARLEGAMLEEVIGRLHIPFPQ